MADFYLKAGDRYPVMRATLLDSDRKVIDLSAATAIDFLMRRKTTDSWIVISASITDAPNGKVEVHWGPTDTVEAGTYKGFFRATFPGPLVMSVPNSGCKTILIQSAC